MASNSLSAVTLDYLLDHDIGKIPKISKSNKRNELTNSYEAAAYWTYDSDSSQQP